MELTETRVDRTLDCRDTLCPGPIVEVMKALRSLHRGQVLEVIATDPGFVPDVEAFARRTGHALLRVERRDGTVHAWLRCLG